MVAQQTAAHNVGPLGLIAMQGCLDLGEKVNAHLNLWRHNPELADIPVYAPLDPERDDYMIRANCIRFSNGEGKSNITETVRGYDLYLLCDIGNHGVTYPMYGRDVPMSPDDHFQDLKRIIAAAGGKARRISVIMPMLYESRQDRRHSRESLDCALALQELERMGVDNIITFDTHDSRVQNAIPLCGFESIYPTYQLFKGLLRAVPDLSIDADHLSVVSPDLGGMGRNIYYATMLELNMGMFYKRRDYTRVVDGRNPIIAHEYLGEDVSGKDVIIADDMLATGDSLLEVATELKRRGANRIICIITFAMFTQGSEKFTEAVKNGIIHKVISTNLTYTAPEIKTQEWFEQVDMSKYIAYMIATLNQDHTISHLLSPAERIQKILKKHREGQKRSEQLTML